MKHLHKDIESLKNHLLHLISIVENNLAKATLAIKTQDQTLAQDVADSDDEIDELEVQIEDFCLKTLALHQPVAIDLRLITSVLKMNNDIERIGDLVCSMAQHGASLASVAPVPYEFDFGDLSAKTIDLLKRTVRALIELDESAARAVLLEKGEVDKLNRVVRKAATCAIMEDPQRTVTYLRYRSISRSYKRISALTTNMAEDIIYMITGDIVRHQDRLEPIGDED